MPTKLTKEQYLSRCQAAHGETYGLEHVDYEKTSSKVQVECYTHGFFYVNAGTFMRGTGCAKCAWVQNGLRQRTTQEEFVKASIAVHDNAYDYSLVEYVTSEHKISILCNGCGVSFQMTPDAHLSGQGCRSCGYKRNGKNSQTDFSKFVADATAAHGGLFTYEHVEAVWQGIKNTRFNLYCKIHNEEFSALASLHVKGTGCPKCSNNNRGLKTRGSTDKFVSEAVARFGGRFDYSRTSYLKNNSPVHIRCKKHNSWLSITPNRHLHPESAGGCPDCAREMTSERCKKSTDQFIAEAVGVHGFTYDYSRALYDGAGKRVEIGCEKHGYFWQWPGTHTAGGGCPECAETGYKTSKSGHLYVFSDGVLTKVGITNKDPEVRCRFISNNANKNFSVLKSYHFTDGRQPSAIETILLKELRKVYKQCVEKFNGSTECFYNVNLAALLNRIEELIAAQTKEQHSSTTASLEAHN